jgi:hypothetical protein
MRRRTERGFALVAVLLVMTLLLGIGAAIHTGVVGETGMRGAHARATAGFYAAEAAINRGMGDYRNIFLEYRVPEGADFDQRSFTLGHRTVKYQLTAVPGNPTLVTVPAGRPFSGLQSLQYRYTASSSSELRTGDVEASLGTEFNIDYIPLFQFLAFYSNDLEIAPGPNMTLHGPIHTNGTLYLNSENTLTISELPQIPTVSVTAAGNVFRGRKDTTACNGTVQVAKLVDSNTDGALDLRAVSCSGVQSSSALSPWLGALKSRQATVSVPTPDIIARGTGTFWQASDIRIVLNLSAPDASGYFPIQVQDVNGNVDAVKNARLQAFMVAKPGRIFYSDPPNVAVGSTACTTTGASHCNPSNYLPAFGSAGAVYACANSDLNLLPAANCPTRIANQPLSSGGMTARRGGFYNNREGAWVRMLNINMYDLLEWNEVQGVGNRLFDPMDNTYGGIVVFLSVQGSGSNGIPSPRYGVRVFGSPRLTFPSMPDLTGVTIVSDQGVYLEGTYNVGGGGDPKQPAAIMGDTINVLSNNWSGTPGCKNDCQSRMPLAQRLGTSTVVNAAFIGGVDLTTNGNYNGGFENYPRFHEDWSGQTLTYRGSFVSLGTPRHNNGAWCGTGGGCNIYNAPARNWDYDVDFQDVTKLPPLTPRFISVQQILFTENFR